MNSRDRPASADGSARDPDRGRKADILLVGLQPEEVRTVPSRLLGALAGGTVEVGLDALSDARIGDAMAILSPVMGADFDAVDLAERLVEVGFDGRYIAFAGELAHKDMIRNEVRAVAPNIAFDIVTMGKGPRLAV